MHVLFICTGNICRSPTAERLSVVYSSRMGVTDFSASSAGIRAVVAHPMHRHAARVLEQLGGDPSDFSARQFNSKMAKEPDLILTMSSAHRDAVLEIAPRGLHRTFTLSEAAQLANKFGARDVADLCALRPQLTSRELVEIPDPIGETEDVFTMVGSMIADLLPPILALRSPK